MAFGFRKYLSRQSITTGLLIMHYFLTYNKNVLVCSEDLSALCMMALNLHRACNVHHVIRVCDKDANNVLRLELTEADESVDISTVDYKYVESFMD